MFNSKITKKYWKNWCKKEPVVAPKLTIKNKRGAKTIDHLLIDAMHLQDEEAVNNEKEIVKMVNKKG